MRIAWIGIWLAVLTFSSANAAENLFPTAGANGICPDTTLRITFDSAPELSRQGKIIINDTATGGAVETIDTSSPTATESIGGVPGFKYYPVTTDGNAAVIHPANHALNYNKTYSISIDAGVFKGQSKPIQWPFSTRPSAPKLAGPLTIDAAGAGDFCTVQGAIDFVPDGNTRPITLLIKSGTYTELICMTNKNNLTFQGENRKSSVIDYANNNRFNPSAAGGVYHRGVFLAKNCNDLTLSNLTIRDTTPRGGSQAEAIILNGSSNARAILKDVDLYSFQDTLQINGQAYVSDCYIEGDVDFMWGSGPCFFENCHCYGTRSKAYYTQIRNTSLNHGYVFHHCTFDGPPGVTNMYLSRIDPRRFPDSEVVLIDCVLGKSVGGVGWLLNNSTDAPRVHFWEFNSHDADGNPADTSQRLSASKQLTQSSDAKAIAHYSDASWVLGGWNPTAQPTK
jgi:pectin methylesterase-like acyl-CoA thioesterase